MTFMERLGKAPVEGGCKEDNWHIWCPSVIEVDGVYHLFASRWPANKGFDGWGSDSEIARYISVHPGGPFVFQETVLETHFNPPFENTAHNPEIKRAPDGTFVLFYFAGEAPRKTARTGMATAPSIAGPWTRHGLIHQWYNPTAVIRSDNSVLFALNGFGGRGPGVNKVRAWRLPHYSVWPNIEPHDLGLIIDDAEAHPEDICLFFINNHYELIAHRYDEGQDNRQGIHFVSSDATGAPGTWRRADPFDCYGPMIQYDDGSELEAERRERPKVLQDEDGRVVCLYTAIFKDGKSWIVGVPVNPPYN